VARLAQLAPPAGLDLVDEVLVQVGRRYLSVLDWPLVNLVHQVPYRARRVHLGEVRMTGLNGEVVGVIRYTDKIGYDCVAGGGPRATHDPI
jgi:hypothetical protein